MYTKARARALISLLLMLCLLLSSCGNPYLSASDYDAAADTTAADTTEEEVEEIITMDSIPDYSGEPWVVIDGNQPDFDDDLKASTESFEYYGDLDSLARCTACEANIGVDLMPTDDRGSIGSVHPSGWMQAEYDCVSGKDLYNRCHLIGYQLTAENANPNNLITGTRYLNIDGMLPFEDLVADYVKETENHVLYLVTPVFEGDELVARGVHMEGWSVEDQGEGVCFNVYCYNVQPGVEIDYASGASQLAADGSIYAITENTVSSTTNFPDGITPAETAETVENGATETVEAAEPAETAEAAEAAAAEPETTLQPEAEAADDSAETHDYVLNTKTMKFHNPDCGSVSKLGADNRKDVTCTRQELIDEGYSPCGNCKP